MSHFYIDIFSIANHTDICRQRGRPRKFETNIPYDLFITALTNNSSANVTVSNSSTFYIFIKLFLLTFYKLSNTYEKHLTIIHVLHRVY